MPILTIPINSIIRIQKRAFKPASGSNDGFPLPGLRHTKSIFKDAQRTVRIFHLQQDRLPSEKENGMSLINVDIPCLGVESNKTKNARINKEFSEKAETLYTDILNLLKKAKISLGNIEAEKSRVWEIKWTCELIHIHVYGLRFWFDSNKKDMESLRGKSKDLEGGNTDSERICTQLYEWIEVLVRTLMQLDFDYFCFGNASGTDADTKELPVP
ncbi:hypothetical protein BJ508DRAFT_380126 [Ascobolus immersus RN42]|uniref:Uncharacterized protein n=1 Tax=Ascobolus immersus RN42 TaxID=1160509 RepID=A0A3N4HND0_ASCIM|nr:hypothetical protein BJ508DRAFT_380126 [Ascobolus immersus RN42]